MATCALISYLSISTCSLACSRARSVLFPTFLTSLLQTLPPPSPLGLHYFPYQHHHQSISHAASGCSPNACHVISWEMCDSPVVTQVSRLPVPSSEGTQRPQWVRFPVASQLRSGAPFLPQAVTGMAGALLPPSPQGRLPVLRPESGLMAWRGAPQALGAGTLPASPALGTLGSCLRPQPLLCGRSASGCASSVQGWTRARPFTKTGGDSQGPRTTSHLEALHSVTSAETPFQ